MPANKIMVIRHAEKPSDDGAIEGVTAAGEKCKHELIVRGWQRAGALARLFAPQLLSNQVAPKDQPMCECSG